MLSKLAKNSDDEDENDDEGEENKSQDSEANVDPSKSTGNYQYAVDFDKITTVISVYNFRK